MSDLAATVSNLNILERERRAFIIARVKLQNMAASRVRSMLGFNPREKGVEADPALKARALKIVTAIAEGTRLSGDDARVAEAVREFVEPLMLPMPLLDASEKRKIKEMEKLTKELPPEVVAFQKSDYCKGFGPQGLAILVAICHGDNMQGLADFATPAKVWRRVGLEANPSDQHRAMYKLNRAQMFAFIYDPVVRHQTRKEPEAKKGESAEAFAARHAAWVALGGVPGAGPIAIGPLGALYLEKKAPYMLRVEATADLPAKIGERRNPDKWTPKRADLAARRYMAKRLLRNLWQVWREAEAFLPTIHGVPLAESSSASDLIARGAQTSCVAAPGTTKRRRKSAGGEAIAFVQPSEWLPPANPSGDAA